MSKYRGESPPYKRLFGHLSNKNYKAPEGKRWRHEQSDSDDEGFADSDADSDDDDQGKGQGGDDSDSEKGPDDSGNVAQKDKAAGDIDAEIDDMFDTTVLDSDSSKTDSGGAEFVMQQRGSRVTYVKDTASSKAKAAQETREIQKDPSYVPESSSPVSKSGSKRKGKEPVPEPPKKKKKVIFQPASKSQSASRTKTTAHKSSGSGSGSGKTATVDPQFQNIPSQVERSLQTQIDDLNRLVRMLLEQNLTLTTQNNRLETTVTGLQTTVTQNSNQIVLLSEENSSLKAKVSELSGELLSIKGKEEDDDDEDDDDDEGDDDDDGDDVGGKDDDDESDDDDDSSGAAGTSQAPDSSKSVPKSSERRTKGKEDRSSGAKKQSSQAPPSQSTALDDPAPLSTRKTPYTAYVDEQGVIHGYNFADEEYEEGEILHSLTKEQIAELFELNKEDVVIEETFVDTSYHPEPTEFDHVDEVEIEDMTAEEYPEFYKEDIFSSVPTFTSETVEEADEILKSKTTEPATTSTPIDPMAEILERKRQRAEFVKWLQTQTAKIPPPPPKQLLKFRKQRGVADGPIISWGFFGDLQGMAAGRTWKGAYVVKRTGGLQYFGRACDLKTLPYYDVLHICKLKMICPIPNSFAEWFESQLKFEYRTGWKNFRPQFPKIVETDEIHPTTGRKIKKSIYKLPNTMKNIPLRKMEQRWSKWFRWWYYDEHTGEAVIVLEETGNKWRTIRVLEPMWLINCAMIDLTYLHVTQIFYKQPYQEQAMQFQNVVKVCFAHDINSGSEFTKKKLGDKK